MDGFKRTGSTAEGIYELEEISQESIQNEDWNDKIMKTMKDRIKDIDNRDEKG